MTRYLLDTHVWLWLQTTPERLGDEVGELLVDRTHTLLLSAASGWEIAIEYRLGELPLPEPPGEYVPDRMRRDGQGHASADRARPCSPGAELPDHHNDPFDRLLVAQAQELAIPIMTADPQLSAYAVDWVPVCEVSTPAGGWRARRAGVYALVPEGRHAAYAHG